MTEQRLHVRFPPLPFVHRFQREGHNAVSLCGAVMWSPDHTAPWWYVTCPACEDIIAARNVADEVRKAFR